MRDELAAVRQVWEELKPVFLEVVGRPAGDPQGAAAYALVQSRLPLLGDRVHWVVTAYVARIQGLKWQIFVVLSLSAALDCALLFLGILVVRNYQKERRRAEEDLEIRLALQRMRNEILLMGDEADWEKVIQTFQKEVSALIPCSS